MSIKNELVKRLDDHGYKLNDEGNIVVKFSKLIDGAIATVEKLILKIGDWCIDVWWEGFDGKRMCLMTLSFKGFILCNDEDFRKTSEFFDPEDVSKVMELLKLTHDILDEIISNNNTPDRYPTQSKKDVIERELKNNGWCESEGVFCFGNLDLGIYDDHLEITSDRKQMIISYEDLVQNASQCINDIGLSFDMPQLDFSTFIEDLASIIKGMSIKTQVQNEIPKRYQTQSDKNFIDVLKNEMMSHERFLGFLEGNVYKYVFRYRNKGGKKDLRKAKHYLDLLEAEIDE